MKTILTKTLQNFSKLATSIFIGSLLTLSILDIPITSNFYLCWIVILLLDILGHLENLKINLKIK